MIGTVLTIFFGLVISKLSDAYTRIEILRIKSSHDVYEGFFNSPGRLNVASLTVATGRKLSSFIQHVAHDVSQSTLKVENKLKEVISHTNLLYASDDKISLLNTEESDNAAPVTIREKMFFIGHDEEDGDDHEHCH